MAPLERTDRIFPPLVLLLPHYRAASSRLQQKSHVQAGMVTLLLGYNHPFGLLEEMGLLVENENNNAHTSSLDLGFSEGILKQAEDLVQSLVPSFFLFFFSVPFFLV